MGIYVINLLSIPIWKILINKIKTQRNRDDIVVFAVCLQTALIIGCRGISVGVDSRKYEMIFESIKGVEWKNIFSYYLEPGYVLINKLVFFLGGEFRWVLLINAAITMIGIYNFIIQCSNNKIMSLYLFITIGYFGSTMNIMRQFLSLTFILMAYICVLNKKKNYIIFLYVVIAMLIHTSSIVVMAVIIIYKVLYLKNIKYSNILKAVFLFCSIIAVFLLGEILSLFNWINYDYLVSGAGYEYSIFNFSFLLKLVMIGVGIYVLGHQKRYIDQELNNIQLFHYLNIVSCLMNVASISFNMFTRLNIYFSFSLIVLIPNIIEVFPISNKKIIKAVLYFIFFVLFIIQLFSNNNGIVPYNTLI